MLATDKTVRGNCPICGLSCQVVAHLRDGQPVKVKGAPNSPAPAMCARAASALEYHSHPERVNVPLKRVGARGVALATEEP